MVDIESLENEIHELKFELDSLKKSSDNIVPHKHCLNCGIAIPPDKTFCSQKCEEEWNNMVKRKKRFTYIWLGFLLLLLLFLVIGGSL